ncbi:hypothetical protein F5X68DRAFT_228403 [Plectosphaerella plurivora]|uniref:gamma-glutamylcyclotransferase n=1 Tax=Plectosphaerella plurivora TaxID=936078 RepID=A0A9P8VKG9_9PEZI|nr:hypothetical protein F5X68DRAFT_228403 [Plectosphaerella plurivora]
MEGLWPGYYFAYGSNLSTAQMRYRCPRAKPIALAHLNGPWTFQINERGFANIHSPPTPPAEDIAAVRERRAQPYINAHPTPGVYGMLYRTTLADERSLDYHEGVPFAYQRKLMPVTVIYAPSNEGPGVGVTVEALVYVDHRTNPGVPGSDYIERMNRGIAQAENWCLPEWYVEHVLRRFIPENMADEWEQDPEDEDGRGWAIICRQWL